MHTCPLKVYGNLRTVNVIFGERENLYLVFLTFGQNCLVMMGFCTSRFVIGWFKRCDKGYYM